MMDSATLRTIEAIHAAGHQLVYEFTGAGSLALTFLHAVPGSSRTILEATDRYCPASLRELLDATPAKAVDPATAAAMAERAYIRACRLGDDDASKIGVSATATIATHREKRGDHRCCVAIQNHQSVTTYDLRLTKGARDRHAEESLVATMVINAIAEAANIPPLRLPLLEGEEIFRQSSPKPDPLDSLFRGSTQWVTISPDGYRQTEGAVDGLLYSGSFNPLHFGHDGLAAAASRVTAQPVTFEIPAVNADKAPIGRSELERRLSQFRHRHPVAITRAPLFADKARLFPGRTFIMGYDTATRLLDPRFYGDSEAARDASLSTLLAAKIRILVAGRLDGPIFKTLMHLPVPPAAAELFIELPESDFRADISATLLRQRHAPQPVDAPAPPL